MDSFEFNGGNSDIMHGNSNLDSVCKEATSEKCFEEENEFINEELNGDFKLMLSPKKNYLSPGKKKLRKLKTESTNVENVHKAFTLMSSKSSKRKTSNEVEISSDDTEEFNGFDLKDLEMFEPGNVILKKLIAEVETSNYLMPKRRKTLPSWKNVKNADYLIDEMDDNTTDSEDQKAVAESDVYNITADESSSKSEKSANSSLSISSNRSKKGRLSRGASPGNAIRQKVSVDIKNPAYREPFKYGWKRELVYRAGASENQVRRMADIYYYTPEGKKVRSFREVIVSLTTSDLTIDNFTFFKEPLGINDPLKEIIRDAKKAKDSFSNKSAKKLSKKAVELLSTKKISIKKGVEKSLPGTVAFKASPKTVKVPATFKVKLPPKRDILKKDAKSPPMIPVENEVSSPPIWGTPNIRKQPLTEKSSLIKSKKLIKAKVQEPCSIRCSTSMGLVPSLQCYVCLCLYHSECAGKHEVKRSPTFVCKNCQLEIDDSLQYESVPALNPPPLIPISILSAQNSMPIDQTGTLPKLQLIPKLDTEGSTQSDVLNISKIGSSDNQIILNEKIKKKWYPENENKFLPDRELVLLKPAQNIVSMNNKKFIVIPKNNAMAVQPAMTLRKDKIEDSKLHFLNNVDVSSCQTDIEMLNPILNTANVSNMHLLNSGKNIKSTVDKLESSIFENPVALSDKSLSPISTNLFKENFFDTHILLHTNPENQYNAFSPSMRKKKVLAEHYKAMQLDTFFKNTR